jgi:hypothetical protein
MAYRAARERLQAAGLLARVEAEVEAAPAPDDGLKATCAALLADGRPAPLTAPTATHKRARQPGRTAVGR